ncbi:MAG TPA: hypothetical protein VN851_18510, partial [Thermoanaerobaculia bacterium]|nr:hypothetical protein [Thermoanaerobaculia bacterium]
IATSRSLRARVSARRAELGEIRSQLCHFCGSEPPDWEKSVVIKGKKETRREYHYRSTTIYYAVLAKILRRCARCARFHDSLRKTENVVTIGAVSSCAGVAFIILSAIGGWEEWGCALVLPILGIILAAYTIGSICLSHLSRRWTPTNHRKYGDYKDSEEARALLREGYTLEVDWSSNAVASFKSSKGS